MPKRVLFLANHRPDRSPGQRFRFEQYLPHLEEHGFECHLSPLIRTEREDHILYGAGHYMGKSLVFLDSVRTRASDWRQRDTYDIVFIYREALMTRHTVFERLFRRSRARLIFDFDDAIWLPAVSPGNRTLEWLKNPAKTGRLLSWADMVFAGNRYLADYASRFCDRVRVVPTTVDTETFRPLKTATSSDGTVEIGWTGSVTTIEHFIHGLPALRNLRQKYGDRVRFKVVGDAGFRDQALGIRGLPWRRETELADLSDHGHRDHAVAGYRVDARQVWFQGSHVHGAGPSCRHVAGWRQYGNRRRWRQRVSGGQRRRMGREALNAHRAARAQDHARSKGSRDGNCPVFRCVAAGQLRTVLQRGARSTSSARGLESPTCVE